VIPAAAITAWSAVAPWATLAQIEQDLILSRLIVEIALDATLGQQLAMRGGTCLHKLFVKPALRYSEDLDYVQIVTEPSGPLFDALRVLASRLRLDVVRTETSDRMIRLRYRTPATDGSTTIRIKVEVNTREKVPFQEHRLVPFAVQSPWFTGAAHVRTFTLEELLATKVRALYQRRKGRDLFDLWIGLTQLHADVEQVAQAFRYYLPAVDAPAADIRQNLAEKTTNRLFRTDLEPLIQRLPAGYAVERAMQDIQERLVKLL
jgi:predicted nucleotidyltransferase component of viral defense system